MAGARVAAKTLAARNATSLIHIQTDGKMIPNYLTPRVRTYRKFILMIYMEVLGIVHTFIVKM